MYPILLHIGPLTLHTYGLFIAVGFLAAYALGRREFIRNGLSAGVFENLSIALMVGGLIGARVVYFGLVDYQSFFDNPLSFFKVWQGGLVYYGGFIGGILVLWLFQRSLHLPLLQLTDMLAKPLILGQAIGRIGCFFAGCCYGRSTTSCLGVTFTNPDSLAPVFMPLFPTQLFESAGDFLLLGLLWWVGRKAASRGLLTILYLIGYGCVRFVVEFFRNDVRGQFFMGLSPSQWGSLLIIFSGIIVWIVSRERKPRY